MATHCRRLCSHEPAHHKTQQKRPAPLSKPARPLCIVSTRLISSHLTTPRSTTHPLCYPSYDSHRDREENTLALNQFAGESEARRGGGVASRAAKEHHIATRLPHPPSIPVNSHTTAARPTAQFRSLRLSTTSPPPPHHPLERGAYV